MITILIITIILFIWGKFTPDIVALLSMISLFLFGILDLNENLSGFSNTKVIIIASLFVIAEKLSQTGWTAENSIFNFEGGCYAMVINLTEEKEADIYRAIKPRAILENVIFKENMEVD